MNKNILIMYIGGLAMVFVIYVFAFFIARYSKLLVGMSTMYPANQQSSSNSAFDYAYDQHHSIIPGTKYSHDTNPTPLAIGAGIYFIRFQGWKH